jgi:hypothetical protein
MQASAPTQRVQRIRTLSLSPTRSSNKRFRDFAVRVGVSAEVTYSEHTRSTLQRSQILQRILTIDDLAALIERDGVL